MQYVNSLCILLYKWNKFQKLSLHIFTGVYTRSNIMMTVGRTNNCSRSKKIYKNENLKIYVSHENF